MMNNIEIRPVLDYNEEKLVAGLPGEGFKNASGELLTLGVVVTFTTEKGRQAEYFDSLYFAKGWLIEQVMNGKAEASDLPISARLALLEIEMKQGDIEKGDRITIGTHQFVCIENDVFLGRGD